MKLTYLTNTTDNIHHPTDLKNNIFIPFTYDDGKTGFYPNSYHIKAWGYPDSLVNSNVPTAYIMIH